MELIGKSPFNTLMLYGAPDRAKLDEARRNGLMVISGVNHFPLTPEGDAALAEYVRSVKDHPALLAWYAFDVGGADPYPVPNEPLEQCTSWTENVVRRTGRRRAVWMVPQAFNWANYDRPFGRVPTREELRTMTRLCLDAGATGLVYFKFGDLMNNAKSPSTTFESRWADLVAVTEEVRPEWVGKLDHAPVWKDVQTVYYDTASDPAFTVKGEYFKGKFVSAADDNRTGSRKFKLRRAFTLPSKPVKAYFQAMGDNEATFSLNGEKVLKFRYSNEPYAPNRPGSGEIPGGGIAAVTVREDGRLMGSPDAQVAKLFAPTDADVVLGTYADGKPGLVAKKTGKSVSFFSGAWQLDQKFIAELVRRSTRRISSTTATTATNCQANLKRT